MISLSVARLVERDRGAKKGVDDVRVVVELLVHHQGKDSHLRGTAVIQLDGGLLGDNIIVPLEKSLRLLNLGGLDLLLSGTITDLD
jgi:hypothetical protein